MNTIVIDSNILVGVLDTNDSLHVRATELDASVPISVQRIYFDIVVNESLSVLARRFEEKKREDSFPGLVQRVKTKLPSSEIIWLGSLTETYYEEILQLLIATKGTLNFNDAFLALYMKKFDLQYLLSFDTDFDNIDWIQRISTVSDIEKYLQRYA
jgi:predicted nucleic acid-binding protein